MLCSETGNDAVNDLTLCKEAAKVLSLDFEKTEDLARYPKGCYSYGVVYFNRHVHGSRNPNARQICKLYGKKLRYFPTSMQLLV